MTAPFTTFVTGRPDWSSVGGRSGRLYYTPNPVAFSTPVQTDPFIVWPYSALQFQGFAGGFKVQYQLGWFVPDGPGTSLATYTMHCPAVGSVYATIPNAGPYCFLSMTSPGNANNTYSFVITSADVGLGDAPRRVDAPLVRFEGSIAAGATHTDTALTAVDQDIDIALFSGAASADLDVFTTSFSGFTDYLYVARAIGKGPVNLRVRSLPEPLTISLKNNDAVSQSFKSAAFTVYN